MTTKPRTFALKDHEVYGAWFGKYSTAEPTGEQ